MMQRCTWKQLGLTMGMAALLAAGSRAAGADQQRQQHEERADSVGHSTAPLYVIRQTESTQFLPATLHDA